MASRSPSQVSTQVEAFCQRSSSLSWVPLGQQGLEQVGDHVAVAAQHGAGVRAARAASASAPARACALGQALVGLDLQAEAARPGARASARSARTGWPAAG